MPRCPIVSMSRLQPPAVVAQSKEGTSLALFGGGAGMRPTPTVHVNTACTFPADKYQCLVFQQTTAMQQE